jgi:hypothetical protein
VVSAFYRRGPRLYTLCDRLSALPYRLSDGCIVPAATEKGGHLEGLGAAGPGLAGGTSYREIGSFLTGRHNDRIVYSLFHLRSRDRSRPMVGPDSAAPCPGRLRRRRASDV